MIKLVYFIKIVENLILKVEKLLLSKKVGNLFLHHIYIFLFLFHRQKIYFQVIIVLRFFIIFLIDDEILNSKIKINSPMLKNISKNNENNIIIKKNQDPFNYIFFIMLSPKY